VEIIGSCMVSNVALLTVGRIIGATMVRLSDSVHLKDGVEVLVGSQV